MACALKYMGLEAENGDKPFRQYSYLISGTDSEEAALAQLSSATAAERTISIPGKGDRYFYRSSIRIREHAPSPNPALFYWEGVVRYDPKSSSVSVRPANPNLPDTIYSISCGTATATIKTALEQRRYGSAEPSVGNAINVVENDGRLEVQGVGIMVPVATLRMTKFYAMSQWGSVVSRCINAVGCANSAPFSAGSGLTFAAEELLFAGVEVAPDTEDTISAQYQFLVSPSSSGDIDGISYQKPGWRYLWAFYRDRLEDNALAKKAVSIYVARVYPSVSFSSIVL